MPGKAGRIPSAQRSLQTDLTKGSIWRGLLWFAVPLLVSSLIQQLYHTVDLIFIGQLLGKEASAAVGASSLLVSCLVGFFTGMSIGSNVLAARYFGSQKPEALKSLVSVAFLISIAGGLALTVVGYILAPVFLRVLRIPEGIFALAVDYLRVYVLGLVPMAGYNIGAGVLRGLGDSRAPMLYQLVGGICNIGANALFLGVFRWGVRGSALATLCSQSIAAVLIFGKLCRLDERYRLRLREMRIQPQIVKDMMLVGVPAGVQAMTVTLSNLIVQSQINQLGVDSIAAFTAYFKVELFIYLPIVAIGQATVTFTGQNLGAHQADRAIQGTRTSLLLGLGITVVASALLMVFRVPAFGLFAKDASVIAIGSKLAMTTFPFYFLYVFMEVFASFIRGNGKTLPPTVMILLNMCLIRPIYVTVISGIYPGAIPIAWVYPLTWLTTSICMTLYYLRVKRQVQ